MTRPKFCLQGVKQATHPFAPVRSLVIQTRSMYSHNITIRISFTFIMDESAKIVAGVEGVPGGGVFLADVFSRGEWRTDIVIRNILGSRCGVFDN